MTFDPQFLTFFFVPGSDDSAQVRVECGAPLDQICHLFEEHQLSIWRKSWMCEVSSGETTLRLESN